MPGDGALDGRGERVPELECELPMSQEFHRMILRLIGAVSLLLALLPLAYALPLPPQASADEISVDSGTRLRCRSLLRPLPSPRQCSVSPVRSVRSPLSTSRSAPNSSPSIARAFADGNHISRSTGSSIYRDAQGRVRRDSQLSVPGLPAGTPPPPSSPSWTTSLAMATFGSRRRWLPIVTS